MLESEYTVLEISAAFINSGFGLDNTAAILNQVGVSIDDAYTGLIAALGTVSAENVAIVANALIDGGYEINEVYSIVVPVLEDELGQDTGDIVITLLGQIDTPVTDAQKSKAQILAGILETEYTVSQISAAFVNSGFGLDNTAAILNHLGVSIGDAYDGLIGAVGGVTAENVVIAANALIDGGYGINEVYSSVVQILKNDLGQNSEDIVIALLGQLDTPVTAAQKSKAQLLAGILLESEYTILEISAAFINSGFGLDNTAAILNQVGVSVGDAYDGLIAALGGVNAENVAMIANALMENLYGANEVYLVVVTVLKDELGQETEDIVLTLLGQLDSPVTDAQKNKAKVLASILEAEHTVSQISAAFINVGLGLDNTAWILNQLDVNIDDAYDALIGALGGVNIENVGMIANALMEAGYDITNIYEKVIPVLRSEGATATVIVNMLISPIAPVGQPTTKQMNNAKLLALMLTDAGCTVQQVTDAFIDISFGLDNTAAMLNYLELSTEDAYFALLSSPGGYTVQDVVFNLFLGGYIGEEILATAIANLQDQGDTASQIITAILGTIEEGSSATPEQLNNAKLLASALNDAGYSKQQICDACLENNFGLEDTTAIFISLGVNIEDTYYVLVNSTTSSTIAEIVPALVAGGYNASEVFATVVAILEADPAGHTVTDIVALILGELIDGQPTLAQMENAKHLTGALVGADYTLMEVSEALLNNEFSLENIAKVLDDTNIGLADAYQALINANGAQDIKDLTYALAAAGYDSFSVFNIATTQLKNEGREDNEIIQILIGELDPDNSQQMEYAQELTNVLKFQFDRNLAENTSDSFISLMNQGYTFTQIIDMLIERYTQAEIEQTLSENIVEIVKELAKDGKSANQIVEMIIENDSGSGNRNNLIAEVMEQLIRNDYSTFRSEIAFYIIGVNQADMYQMRLGKRNAADYDITTTEHANHVYGMLAAGNTWEEISQFFAQAGYQLEYVAKLFKALDVVVREDVSLYLEDYGYQPIDVTTICDALENLSLSDIHSMLSNTQAEFRDSLLWSDNTVISSLLSTGYTEQEVFEVATVYLQALGLSSEAILIKLTTAKVKTDENELLSQALVGQYYKSIATNTPQSYITLFTARYSLTWIKLVLLEKGYLEADIDNTITDNFEEIFSRLDDNGLYFFTIASLFDIEENPDSDYVILLAEHAIYNGYSENNVRSILIDSYGANPNLVAEGIQRAQP